MDLGVTAGAMHRAIAGQLHALRGEDGAARRHLERAAELADEGLPGEFVVPLRGAWAALALAERRRRRGAPPRRRRARRRRRRPRPALHAGAALARRRAEAELAERARARRREAEVAEANERATALLADLERLLARSAAAPDALAHRAIAAAELSRARGTPEPALWQAAAGAWLELAEPYPAAYARLPRRRGAARLRRRAAAAACAAGRGERDGGRARRASAAGAGRRRWPGARGCAWLPGPSRARPAEEPVLTPRETDVLRLLADGLTNRQIAERLFISEKTVGTHVAHIFAKLDVHTRVEAAGRAQALGVLSRTSP